MHLCSSNLGQFSCLWVLKLFRHSMHSVPKLCNLVPVNFNLSQCLFIAFTGIPGEVIYISISYFLNSQGFPVTFCHLLIGNFIGYFASYCVLACRSHCEIFEIFAFSCAYPYACTYLLAHLLTRMLVCKLACMLVHFTCRSHCYLCASCLLLACTGYFFPIFTSGSKLVVRCLLAFCKSTPESLQYFLFTQLLKML